MLMDNYSRCKMLQYCSKECQKEHWILVHKSQCKKLAEKSEGAVGEALNANGSHLENLLILLGKTLDRIKHTAMWSDSEVRTQLMQLEQDIRDSKELTKGFRMTNPVDVELPLMSNRPFQQPKNIPVFEDELDLESFELWHTLLLLWQRLFNYNTFKKLRNLKDLRSAVPEELWSGIEDEVIVFLLFQVISPPNCFYFFSFKGGSLPWAGGRADQCLYWGPVPRLPRPLEDLVRWQPSSKLLLLRLLCQGCGCAW